MLHDSDLEENRFQADEWKYYELWEKVEVRLRRKKTLIAFLVLSIFLILSSIPVWMDQARRWQAKAILNRLAIELNQVKLEAIDKKMAFRLRFLGTEGDYVIEKTEKCNPVETSPVTAPEIVRTASLFSGSKTKLVRLSNIEAKNFGFSGILDEFCFDPYVGFESLEQNPAFALLPKEDFEQKADRRVVLLLLQDRVASPILD